MTSSLVSLLRPHQYLKNGFVLVGLASSPLRNEAVLMAAALAFVAVCLAASSVHVFNDRLDLEADRPHLTKRNRPIVNGAVQVVVAGRLAGRPLGRSRPGAGRAGGVVLRQRESVRTAGAHC